MTLQLHNADQLVSWCLWFLSVNYHTVYTDHWKLLRTLSPVHQAYLNKHRWPPVWYLKAVDLYERCCHCRYLKAVDLYERGVVIVLEGGRPVRERCCHCRYLKAVDLYERGVVIVLEGGRPVRERCCHCRYLKAVDLYERCCHCRYLKAVDLYERAVLDEQREEKGHRSCISGSDDDEDNGGGCLGFCSRRNRRLKCVPHSLPEVYV
ncbi:hypothetical protein NP493_1329g00039 [Ridgeia piscesae]|uniref:Uncharacterized protein n=1 Tax=Ridgeia piscesae TaxID=27915 RepID=A0AAD9K7L7_RIDPI|nr:hypothetical protein NP493_1329g00039 [Ridgeia piscesae]